MTAERASEGFYLSDYDRSERLEISHYIHENFVPSELPTHTAWGCVSATGAFIINQTLGEGSATPASVDTAIQRTEGTPGDTSLLGLEFLRRGLSIENYAPFSPLKIHQEKLVRGEINFDTYFKIFQEIIGPIDEEEHSTYRDYYMNTFIPSELAINTRFSEYKKTGQMVSYYDAQITEGLLEGLVNDGKYVLATREIDTGVAHAVAVFRPDTSMPALLFSPMEDESIVWALKRGMYEDISVSAIGAVALWNQGKS